MSRVETLELLSDVVDSLKSIGTMAPGRPLRATDWNVVVKAVSNLAKMVASREQSTDDYLDRRYAQRDHAHTGSMGMGWFEPHTRALIEEGIQGAVEQRAALRDVRKGMDELKGNMEQIHTEIGEVRLQLDELRDRDSARENEITRVEMRVESLRDMELSVGNLTERFEGIAGSVEQALSFREELNDENGNPVNVGGLDSRIGQLEGMRQNLELADGSLVRIREVESAIARLEESSINRNDADDIILSRLREGNLLDETGFMESTAAAIEQRFTPRFDTITETTSRFDRDLQTCRDNITAQDTAFGQLTGRMVTAENRLGAMETLGTRVDSHGSRLTNVEGRVNSHQSALAEIPQMQLRIQGVERVTMDLQDLHGTVGDIDARVHEVESRVGAIDQLTLDVNSCTSRIAAVEAKLPSLEAARGQVLRNTQRLDDYNSRITVNEAQLDNCATVPDQMDALTTQMGSLSSWRNSTDMRLDELTRQQQSDRALAQHVAVLEQTAATNTRAISGLQTSEKNSTAQIGHLLNNFSTLNTRISEIENRSGGGIIRPSDSSSERTVTDTTRTSPISTRTVGPRRLRP